MDLLLTVLKFGGIIVSGTLGILGTLTQTHEQVEVGGKKKLNRWGRWAIRLTIIAFLTAFGAQLAEVFKKRHEDTESRKRTEEQIKQANEVLKRLEEQGRQSTAILTNVEQQGAIARQSLDTLSAQSTRTRTILTNVELQGELAKQSLDALSTQSDRARATLAELQRQNSLAEESRKRAEQQVEAANLSLRYVERLLTPLDSISVSATYELPTNFPSASALLYEISPRAAMAQQVTAHLGPGVNPEFLRRVTLENKTQITPFPPGAFFAPFQPKPNTMEAFRFFAWPASAATPTNPSGLFRVEAQMGHLGESEDADELSAVGYIRFPGATNLTLFVNSTESFFSLGPYDIPGVKHGLFGTNVQTHIRLGSLTNRFWAAAVKAKGRTAWAAWKSVWADFAKPDMRLEITRETSGSGVLPPDLIITGTGGVHSASLIFLPASGKLALVWEFSSSGSTWGKSQQLQSIPDLAEATLRVRSELPFKLVTPHAICLRQISLRFRGSTLVLTNFHSVDVRDDRWAETTLPHRADILSHEHLQ